MKNNVIYRILLVGCFVWLLWTLLPESAEFVQAPAARVGSESLWQLQPGSGSTTVTRSWEIGLGTKTGTLSAVAPQKRLEITGKQSPSKENTFTLSEGTTLSLGNTAWNTAWNTIWQCELGHKTDHVYRDITSTPERKEHPVYYCVEHVGDLLDRLQVPRAVPGKE